MKTAPLYALAGLALAAAGSPAEVRAELAFAETTVDVGEVRSGLPVQRKLAFVNRGREPVEVREVRAGCGCVRARLEKRLYQPNEGGAVVLDLHTLGQPAGPHAWGVRLATAEGGAGRAVDLVVRAVVVAEVTLEPAALTLFTDHAAGHEVELWDRRSRPFAVREVRSSSPHLAGRLVRRRPDKGPGACYVVRVEVAAGFPEGHHEETLQVVTDDPLYRELRVPVSVVKRPRRPVAALPAEVSLVAAPGQAVPSRVVQLRHRANEPVQVDRVEAADPAVTCRWAAGLLPAPTLRVTVDRARVAGKVLQSSVVVHLRQPAGESVVIPVTCTLP
jgi:hypothetical protein